MHFNGIIASSVCIKRQRNFIQVSNRSSAGALIGDTANWNQQSTQIKSSQMLVFEERGNRSTRRKPLGATNKLNPHMTQRTYDGNRTRATLVGGDCSHHCAIPASIRFKVDRLQIIVVAKNITVLQLFISRMTKMCGIPQLVSAPLNPIMEHAYDVRKSIG